MHQCCQTGECHGKRPWHDAYMGLCPWEDGMQPRATPLGAVPAVKPAQRGRACQGLECPEQSWAMLEDILLAWASLSPLLWPDGRPTVGDEGMADGVSQLSVAASASYHTCTCARTHTLQSLLPSFPPSLSLLPMPLTPNTHIKVIYSIHIRA